MELRCSRFIDGEEKGSFGHFCRSVGIDQLITPVNPPGLVHPILKEFKEFSASLRQYNPPPSSCFSNVGGLLPTDSGGCAFRAGFRWGWEGSVSFWFFQRGDVLYIISSVMLKTIH